MGSCFGKPRTKSNKVEFGELGISHDTLSHLHISERTRTIDLKKVNFTSIIDIPYIRRQTYSIEQKKRPITELPIAFTLTSKGTILRKSNSCSTVQIASSIVSKPHLESTLKCVAYALYLFLQLEDTQEVPIYLQLYDERVHLLNMNYEGDSSKPLKDEDFEPKNVSGTRMLNSVYHFLKYFFVNIGLGGENAIALMVYLDKVRIKKQFVFNLRTWRRVTIAIIILVSKMLDDHAIWNEDISRIMNNHPVEDLNRLEQATLDLIEFNLHVPAGVYTTFYFELKSLGEAAGILNKIPKSLTLDMALELEKVFCLRSGSY